MEFQIRFTEEAKQDLINIAIYIGEDSKINAKRFVRDISQKIKAMLGVFLESGER